jgi:hydrogenase-4 component H
MLRVLRRSFTTPLQTTDYPDAPEPAPAAYRGQVQLDPARCTGDGACARACPSMAIQVVHADDGGWQWELSDARCVFCGLCRDACPTRAIVLSNEFELATRAATDLTTTARFRPAQKGASA